MKRILISGLNAASTPATLAAWLTRFGPVRDVEIIRDGDGKSPIAVVEMDVTDAQAAFIVSRVTDYWHAGALLTATPLLHDDGSLPSPAPPRTLPILPEAPPTVRPESWVRRALRALRSLQAGRTRGADA